MVRVFLLQPHFRLLKWVRTAKSPDLADGCKKTQEKPKAFLIIKLVLLAFLVIHHIPTIFLNSAIIFLPFMVNCLIDANHRRFFYV